MSDLIAVKGLPKYVRIAEALKSDIARGALSPDEQLPSFNEMTKQYQVAKHTIDKAHAILEREGLVRREQGRGVFVQPQMKSRTGNIGLLLLGTTQYDVYTRELVAGIQQQARTCGVNVMLVDEQAPISSKDIDGILLFCDSFQVAPLKLPARMPRVLLLSPAPSIKIANVVADDYDGAKTATQHLLELGHRRISILLAAKSDPYSLQRLAGYKAALEESDVKFDERLCFHINKVGVSVNYFLLSEEYMKAWLSRGWRKLKSTAILAPNDPGAFGIMKALSENGINVPQDVSVVGFDGVEVGVQEELPLTTVQVPLREIGARGAELLWEQIQKGAQSSKKIVIPVQLRTGNSTAPV